MLKLVLRLRAYCIRPEPWPQPQRIRELDAHKENQQTQKSKHHVQQYMLELVVLGP